MYCRKCLAKRKKINMDVNQEEQSYECPACGKVIAWEKNERLEIHTS